MSEETASISIINTCPDSEKIEDATTELTHFHWRLIVQVDPFLDRKIDRISYTFKYKNDDEREDMNRDGHIQGLYWSSDLHKSWGLYNIKVRIYLREPLTIDGEERSKLKLKHNLELEVGKLHTTQHIFSILTTDNDDNASIINDVGNDELNPIRDDPNGQDSSLQSASNHPDYVIFSVTNKLLGYGDKRWLWHLYVEVPEILANKIERVAQKSLYDGASGKEKELIRNRNKPRLFQMSKSRKAGGEFAIRISIYLNAEVTLYDESSKKLESPLELIHQLRFTEEDNTSCHSVRSSSDFPSESLNDSTAPPPPSMWCITYDQLMKVEMKAIKEFGSVDYPTRTMRDICSKIIEPSCDETGTSYALSLNKGGLPIDVFISHGWDGCFSAFVQSIRNAFQTLMVKPNLWICAFSLVQGQNELVAQQVGSSDDPLEKSPFVQAIQASSTYCVVRNSNMDIYSRIWCVCGE